MVTLRFLLRVLVCTMLLAFSVVGHSEPPSADYGRGYLQGLLDSRFPGLGLSVRTFDTQSVTVAARVCVGAAQKRDVERTLAEGGRAQTVTWDAVADCVAPPPSAPPAEVEALPERGLFAPLIADPRQPRFSMSYQFYRTPREDFNAASIALGEYFGFASGFLGKSGASQLGIQAGVFALFNLDAESSDLINADYWFAFPVSYRRGSWSTVLRLYHQSSHLGDEFILGRPSISRINLSYEGVEWLVSYEWKQVRVYGGGGYLLNSEPDLQPWSLHGGAEYLHPKAVGSFDFIAAVDVRSAEELDWALSHSFQAGFELHSRSQRRVRLMLEYFRGHSPNGQFYLDKLRYTGLGLYFGF